MSQKCYTISSYAHSYASLGSASVSPAHGRFSIFSLASRLQWLNHALSSHFLQWSKIKTSCAEMRLQSVKFMAVSIGCSLESTNVCKTTHKKLLHTNSSVRLPCSVWKSCENKRHCRRLAGHQHAKISNHGSWRTLIHRPSGRSASRRWPPQRLCLPRGERLSWLKRNSGHSAHVKLATFFAISSDQRASILLE